MDHFLFYVACEKGATLYKFKHLEVLAFRFFQAFKKCVSHFLLLPAFVLTLAFGYSLNLCSGTVVSIFSNPSGSEKKKDFVLQKEVGQILELFNVSYLLCVP